MSVERLPANRMMHSLRPCEMQSPVPSLTCRHHNFCILAMAMRQESAVAALTEGMAMMGRSPEKEEVTKSYRICDVCKHYKQALNIRMCIV